LLQLQHSIQTLGLRNDANEGKEKVKSLAAPINRRKIVKVKFVVHPRASQNVQVI